MNGFAVEKITVQDLAKSKELISCGVGFLDHMIDQFNSHAQVGVSLTVSSLDGFKDEGRNRFASQNQEQLMKLVGITMGKEFQKLLEANCKIDNGSVKTSHFCCPLDEALVCCDLTYSGKGSGSAVVDLAPYGKYGPPDGRKFVGRMETTPVPQFWNSVASGTSGLEIQLKKIRGDNAHHIIEACFKAFCRAFRNLLDGVDTSTVDSANALYGLSTLNWKASIDLNRHANISRKTKETSIEVDIKLDGGESGSNIATGIQTLDEFLSTIAREAAQSWNIRCEGDLWIDEHHTAEDVAISVGQALNQALGTKAGLNRMWSAQSITPTTQQVVEITMDLSNRPCLTHNLTLSNEAFGEKEGDLSLEMFEHVLDSLVVNSRMTVHIEERSESSFNLTEVFQATAAAFGQALKYCIMVDCRRAGATASSKGTLSV